MNGSTSLLEMRHISFTYPTKQQKSLEDISFSIKEGSFVVLCGQSGSGKSTLLRHIKKNQIPFGEGEGECLYAGTLIQELSDYDNAIEIGYVGQNPESQLVTDRVWHELAFGLENIGMETENIRRKVTETAEYFGMSSWFRKDVMKLSGGQKQLLNLASVMAMEPRFLLLDEPTSQLDPISARRFIQTLVQINQDFGTTILLSEQRLEEVIPLADQILILHNGKLIFDGSSQNLPAKIEEFERQTGEQLPIKEAMPAALRTYMEWQNQTTNPIKKEEKIPVSVRDGKIFLSRFYSKTDVLEGRKEKITDKRQNRGLLKSGVLKRKADGKQIVIKAKHLEYWYDKKTPLLRDVNLEIEQQQCHAILGGNGAGKTTLLKLLCGIYKAKAGKCQVTGKIVCLPQDPKALFAEVTVEEELLAMAPEVEQMLCWLGLADKKEQNPMDLSGGEQQRLALGKILLTEPDIILLDEPTKGLDAAFKQKLAAMIEQLKENGKTILMVSHDIEFCARNADWCTMLFDGEMHEMERIREFLSQNSYYTTAAHRMAMDFDREVILWEEIYEQIKEQEADLLASQIF